MFCPIKCIASIDNSVVGNTWHIITLPNLHPFEFIRIPFMFFQDPQFDQTRKIKDCKIFYIKNLLNWFDIVASKKLLEFAKIDVCNTAPCDITFFIDPNDNLKRPTCTLNTWLSKRLFKKVVKVLSFASCMLPLIKHI